MESIVNYLLQEIPEEPLQVSSNADFCKWEFTATEGRIVVSLWIKPDIHNTGVNVMTVYGDSEAKENAPVFVMDTEGAFFYTYDGAKKCKLSHFESDVWYSVYLSMNCYTGKYCLYIDGEQVLCGEAITKKFEKISAVSVGSYGGIMYVKRLHVYANPVRLSVIHPNWNTYVQGPQKALLYADSQENIRIMGGGCIDGSGDFPGAYGSEPLRVCAVLMVGCDHAQIGDVYIKDAGMWTVPVVECNNLYIHDLNLNSTWYPNRDGIDICDCQDVLIENCNIKADDDAVCFKSGNECGCDNVVVRHSMIISTMANGIKFGTYSYGGFTNCLCEDCIIKDTRTCAISIQSVDGGKIENLQFRRLVIQNVESVFFALIADKARVPEGYAKRIGSISHILFEDIEASGVRRNYGTYLGGFKCKDQIYRIKDFVFRNVNVIYQGGCMECPAEPEEFGKQYPESNVFGVLPASGYYIRHAEEIVFEDCKTVIALPDARDVFYYQMLMKYG